MKMFWLILTLCLFVTGCESTRSESRPDPYISMMDNYMSKLSSWDYSSGEMPAAPKEPTYLRCPEREMVRDSFGRDIEAGIVYGSTGCREINKQRRAAYNAAVKKYESLMSELGAEKVDTTTP